MIPKNKKYQNIYLKDCKIYFKKGVSQNNKLISTIFTYFPKHINIITFVVAPRYSKP